MSEVILNATYSIGITTTGKMIYNKPECSFHADFTPEEHEQAAWIHERRADCYEADSSLLWAAERERDQADEHYRLAEHS